MIDAYVHVVPHDRSVRQIHRVDDQGEQVLARPGEHIVVLPSEPDEYFRSRAQKGHSVERVHMGPNGGSSVTVAEGLDRRCAEVLARALNVEAGIAPRPHDPRGLLVLEEALLVEQLSEIEKRRASLLGELAEQTQGLQDRLGTVRGLLDGPDGQVAL